MPPDEQLPCQASAARAHSGAGRGRRPGLGRAGEQLEPGDRRADRGGSGLRPQLHLPGGRGCDGGDHDYLRLPVKAGMRYLIATFDFELRHPVSHLFYDSRIDHICVIILSTAALLQAVRVKCMRIFSATYGKQAATNAPAWEERLRYLVGDITSYPTRTESAVRRAGGGRARSGPRPAAAR